MEHDLPGLLVGIAAHGRELDRLAHSIVEYVLEDTPPPLELLAAYRATRTDLRVMLGRADHART